MVDVPELFVVCFWSYNIFIVLLFDQLRILLIVKSLQNVIHDKLFCYIYPFLNVCPFNYTTVAVSGKVVRT